MEVGKALREGECTNFGMLGPAEVTVDGSSECSSIDIFDRDGGNEDEVNGAVVDDLTIPVGKGVGEARELGNLVENTSLSTAPVSELTTAA